jgi:hypothetical protein
MPATESSTQMRLKIMDRASSSEFVPKQVAGGTKLGCSWISVDSVESLQRAYHGWSVRVTFQMISSSGRITKDLRTGRRAVASVQGAEAVISNIFT